ncbi:hypothetical protein [Phormidium pseudopriestleyi]|nr:hypothetical protein [Phormidium pseudopriestleyi]
MNNSWLEQNEACKNKKWTGDRLSIFISIVWMSMPGVKNRGS